MNYNNSLKELAKAVRIGFHAKPEAFKQFIELDKKKRITKRDVDEIKRIGKYGSG